MVSLDSARQTGETALGEIVRGVRETLQRQIRRSIGVRGAPPPICVDPEDAFMDVDGAARRIHADLPSMLVGGVASLLLQMLHPLAMTGVAEHSRYREDPLGRLGRTAHFVRATTFGTRDEAADAIERVRRVHRAVRGTTSGGVEYSAEDPRLVEWIHVAEVSMFLAASRSYGPRHVDADEADRYVGEMATIAEEMGLSDPPRTAYQLEQRLVSFRPDLELIDSGRDARDFVMRGVGNTPQRRLAHATIASAAVGVLPPWARRDLELDYATASHLLVIRPAATTLCVAMRFAMSPDVTSRS